MLKRLKGDVAVYPGFCSTLPFSNSFKPFGFLHHAMRTSLVPFLGFQNGGDGGKRIHKPINRFDFCGRTSASQPPPLLPRTDGRPRQQALRRRPLQNVTRMPPLSFSTLLTSSPPALLVSSAHTLHIQHEHSAGVSALGVFSTPPSPVVFSRLALRSPFF